MDILITGRSALLTHRLLRGKLPLLKAMEVPTAIVHPSKLNKASLEGLNMTGFNEYGLATEDSPLDLCVTRDTDRAYHDSFNCHVRGIDLPGSSYLELKVLPQGRDLFPMRQDCRMFIDSIPLVVVTQAGPLHDWVRFGRMTRDVAVVRLAALICEFCGTYVRVGTLPGLDDIVYERPSACTTKEIASYLARIRRIHGIDLARAAVDLAIDRLASPMEFALYAIMRFPPRLGGLGIKNVRANESLEIDPEVLARLGESRVTPDFRIGDAPVGIEYNGGEHLEKYRVRQDKTRAQDYAKLGLVHYPVMFDDVSTLAAMEKTLRDIVDVLSPYESQKFRRRMLRLLRETKYRDARRHLLSIVLPPVQKEPRSLPDVRG